MNRCMSNAAASLVLPSSFLLSVDFEAGEIGEAIVTWCDANDVEHVETVQLLIEMTGWGRRASFSCEVCGDLPLSISHQVAAQAESRAEDNYWGV